MGELVVAAASLPEMSAKGPVMPAWLQRQVEGLADEDPDQRERSFGALRPLPKGDLRIVRRALEEARAIVAGRASIEAIGAWLAPFVVSTRAVPGEAEVLLFAGVLADQGHPACLWSRETQREGLARWTFWPSAAEVEALFQPRRSALGRLIGALERMEAYAAPPPAEAAPVLGLEERQRILEKFRRDFAAAVVPSAPVFPEERPRPRARHLSPDVLVLGVLQGVKSGAMSKEAAAITLRRPDLRPHVREEWLRQLGIEDVV